MMTYFEGNVICTKSGDDAFSTGETYELLEVGGDYFVEYRSGGRALAFLGKSVVLAANSTFERVN